jgi:formylmethanofuran dehydrogenase subunit B
MEKLILFAVVFIAAIFERKKYVCPNCGDACGRQISIDFTYDNSGNHGVCMCKKCISEPKNLDDEKIYENLKKQNWPEYEIALIKKAIHQLKSGDKSVLFTLQKV